MPTATHLARRAIRITAPLHAELVEGPLAGEDLAAHEMLVQTECSVVSAGTEVAIYRGIEAWAKPPTEIGYGAVGRVLRAGAAAKFRTGARIFFRGAHADLHIVAEGYPVPEDLDSEIVPLVARMGQVAFTAVRVARPELGDTIGVIGLGLVGNLCAQLMRLSGCTVIGLDVSPRRLAIARSCGIQQVVDTRDEDPIAAIKRLTGGEMCRVVVEASGVPTMAASAAQLAARHGQVVLLGTPRGRFEGDATELLRAVHHAHRHVSLVGAHEWIYPDHPSPESWHSIERNISQLFALAQQGALHARELISHRVRPERCQEVYGRLLERDESYVGVIFDWRNP